MKYNDIKLVESRTVQEMVNSLVKFFERDCLDVNRVNNSLTSTRRYLEKYRDSAPAIINMLRSNKSHKVMGNLLAATVYPIQINNKGYSMPAYSADMCKKGHNGNSATDGNGIAQDGNSNSNSNSNGNSNGDSNGVSFDQAIGHSNGVAQGVDITGTTPLQKAADQLEGLLNVEDWVGAKALLDSNSDLKALFPSEYQDMIDAAIQADIDAIETKKKADAQAAIQKQAKEDAKIAAEQAAAKKAAEEAEAAAEIAAERQRLADLAAAEAAEAERLKTLEDEKAAAKAKADEAAKIAAAEKAEAEKLEAAKIAAEEAEAERQRIADEEAEKERLRKEKEEERNKTAPGDNLEEPDKVYDWDDL